MRSDQVHSLAGLVLYNYLVHLHISIKLGFVRCLIHTCALGTNYSPNDTRVAGRPAQASSRQSV